MKYETIEERAIPVLEAYMQQLATAEADRKARIEAVIRRSGRDYAWRHLKGVVKKSYVMAAEIKVNRYSMHLELPVDDIDAPKASIRLEYPRGNEGFTPYAAAEKAVSDDETLSCKNTCQRRRDIHKIVTTLGKLKKLAGFVRLHTKTTKAALGLDAAEFRAIVIRRAEDMIATITCKT